MDSNNNVSTSVHETFSALEQTDSLEDAPGDTVLEGAKRKARSGQKGLWADPQPVPPREWRKRKSRLGTGLIPGVRAPGLSLRRYQWRAHRQPIRDRMKRNLSPANSHETMHNLPPAEMSQYKNR